MDQNLKAYNDMANRRKDPKMDKAIAKESLRSYNKNTPMKRDRVVAGFKARRQAKMKDLLKNAVGALGRVASPVAAGASAIKNFRKKKPDFQKGDYSGIKIKRAGGGSIRGYGAARTSGTGLQDENLKPGKSYKPKKAGLGLMFMKKAKDKGAKGAEFLSPMAMLKRVQGNKTGGVMKYKRGSGLDLPVINSVKPTVNKTKRAQNLSRMKIQFTKQKNRAGINSGTLDKILSKTKNPYSDLKATTAKGPKQYSSMAEMRKAKGFKPGESASEFNKRRKILAGVTKAASATKIGKIALGIGAVGLGAKKYLESKMKKKDEPKKKMGGGMMQRPMGYNTGGGTSGDAPDTTKLKKTLKGAKDFRSAYIRDEQKVKKKMGGGMMQKPMGYKHGTSVTASCKLGRNKPTKIT